MTPERWREIREVLHEALELELQERSAYLDRACTADDSLRGEVESLLASSDEAGSSFLESLPLAQATLTEGVETDDPMSGHRLRVYQLVRRIGQGGMGAVFLAVRADGEFRQQVAIKLIRPGLDSDEVLRRFRNERQTLAGLDHPNIVKLLDGGSTPEGLPYLVMDYVEGSPIDEYCDNQKLSIQERLHLFGKVCEAVQYAHDKRVIHRDLKPSNISVTADGVPKLLDFGIAKVLEPAAGTALATQTGTRCMTPAYASPEQVRGRSVTPATDIYSLGVVLYELLTGHGPYRLKEHTPAEIERAICEQQPETPSTAVSRVETETSSDGTKVTKTPELVSRTREGQSEKLRRRLRGDLDNIALKALRKGRDRRYSSVEELAQDIYLHLQHLPVKARRSTLAYRASKFVQRHKMEAGAALIVVIVLAVAALFALNALGLRNRPLGGAGGPQVRSTNGGPPLNTAGRVAIGTRSAVPCESLADLKLPNTDIALTQSAPAGTFSLSDQQPVQSLPAFCRVEGVIRPTWDSEIQFAVWMPNAGWNGALRGVGNSGFGGSINFGDMAPALRYGYATASTDAGHRGDSLDTSWALRHPEKTVDFGYRAVHEMTEKAKAIVRAFYGQAPRRSFFEGCSNGGREALMEAQRFPDDYEGILAGAPPVSVTHLLAAGLYNTATIPAAYIPSSKIPAISAAVLAACDAVDGVTDGIVNDPMQCHFDPSVLRCQGAESDSCLTSVQIAELEKIYAGLRNSREEQLYPGYAPGGEEGEQGWNPWIIGQGRRQGLISTYGLGFFRDMVFENPAWDYRTISAERTVQIADKKIGRRVNATDPDLRRFKSRGGKLILYHGWSDPLIPTLGTITYYDSIVAEMGLKETENFVRLYMAPGMQHCGFGPGPNFFGQFDLSSPAGNPQQVPTDTDAQHNISSALEQWIEKGIAPGPVIATKYLNDLDPAQGVKMTRPLCPYPQIAKYKGIGDTNDAANFVCAKNE